MPPVEGGSPLIRTSAFFSLFHSSMLAVAALNVFIDFFELLQSFCTGNKMNATEGGNEDNNSKRWPPELHHDDDDLFRQPDGTHLGECPICFLPMPLDKQKWSFWPCCSRNICNGCVCANYLSNKNNKTKVWRSCPFCRTTASDEAETSAMMKRVKANDPAALREMGIKIYREGDHDKAFEYYTKAAELGDVESHYWLGYMYAWEGDVVERDEEKAVYHWEKAAIGGHHVARWNLGCVEHENGNMERAVKHLIIAANLGCEDSMKDLWKHYSLRNITKEDLEATLRTHKAAIDETKSAQRDAAEVALNGLYRTKGM